MACFESRQTNVIAEQRPAQNPTDVHVICLQNVYFYGLRVDLVLGLGLSLGIRLEFDVKTN